MIYAIDFDGTIVENRFPAIGAINPEAEQFIRQLKANGDKWILYTMREGRLLDDAIAFLYGKGLAPDAASLAVLPRQEDQCDDEGYRSAHGPPETLADAHLREHLLKVRAKIGPLHNKEDGTHSQGDEGVPYALHKEGSQRLVKGEEALSVLSYGRMPHYIAQPGYFSRAGEHQVHGHANVVGVEGGDGPCRRIKRVQQHLPPEASDVEDGYAQEHGQKDILPSAGQEGLRELLPVYSPKAKPDKEAGHQRPESIAEDILRFLVHTMQR